MPEINENKLLFEKKYDWSREGDEWSDAWGSTEFMWWGTVFPRIHNLVPVGHILEIAPGFGRCTQFLKDLCKELTIVDLAENCITACKKRFSECNHIRYLVNNGKTLEGIPEGSVDFIFSWDSLVHVERDVMESYIQEFSRLLTPNGYGFIHHSNLNEYAEDRKKIKKAHWRGASMSAMLFEAYCEKNGFQCISQELLPWGVTFFTDAISLFTRKGSSLAKPNRVVRNSKFKEECERIFEIFQIYGH